jgi:hypothetical protein
MMAEVRFETDAQDVGVLDGYCSATHQCRTDVMRQILKAWSDKKLHEATVILRVAKHNPTSADDVGVK